MTVAEMLDAMKDFICKTEQRTSKNAIVLIESNLPQNLICWRRGSELYWIKLDTYTRAIIYLITNLNSKLMSRFYRRNYYERKVDRS